MTVIGQRELRNDNAEIVRRVEAGESFTVTRNGKPVADLVPHRPSTKRRSIPTAEVAALLAETPVDVEAWHEDIAAADSFFGPDELDDPWRDRPGTQGDRGRE
ncbi:type II toxin-antitoxin system prevent-host-death family antitoxin [Allosaccharopolyspora coralli]|uniref:Antitoxin n=1 Tax=Allosaccharopolyspora coralli TaxID=2665642 RepID=A0A5Q3Q1J0_9PSEU|nr:type II toxin-antitoxin system prevent-host-death family antitoxin [Allosaccharopolyspora coralli]QGK68448.1 type II toxin-antitoxin system prevent-host-death family antitoxin [Allosaccharopolyspora coralli]